MRKHDDGDTMIYRDRKGRIYQGVIVARRKVAMTNAVTGEDFVGWRLTLRLHDGKTIETCGMRETADVEPAADRAAREAAP